MSLAFRRHDDGTTAGRNNDTGFVVTHSDAEEVKRCPYEDAGKQRVRGHAGCGSGAGGGAVAPHAGPSLPAPRSAPPYRLSNCAIRPSESTVRALPV